MSYNWPAGTDYLCLIYLDDRLRISVREKLKQAKPGRHLDPTELMTFPEDKELCVVQHLREYIRRTDHSAHSNKVAKIMQCAGCSTAGT